MLIEKLSHGPHCACGAVFKHKAHTTVVNHRFCGQICARNRGWLMLKAIPSVHDSILLGHLGQEVQMLIASGLLLPMP